MRREDGVDAASGVSFGEQVAAPQRLAPCGSTAVGKELGDEGGPSASGAVASRRRMRRRTRQAGEWTTLARAHLRCSDAALMLCIRMLHVRQGSVSSSVLTLWRRELAELPRFYARLYPLLSPEALQVPRVDSLRSHCCPTVASLAALFSKPIERTIPPVGLAPLAELTRDALARLEARPHPKEGPLAIRKPTALFWRGGAAQFGVPSGA
ncbi:hypothetical protein AB1Y20_014711 [Prymnesium parvum]|uniref:Uncharacterized protein n=1 Tax=Prymnesium parvum TaxID=97485 RepID=A0AB34IEV0_PRYPA